jgi:hypothetical protein
MTNVIIGGGYDANRGVGIEEVPPPYINLLYLSSKDGVNVSTRTDTSSVTININNTITIRGLHIDSVTIPQSWYTFTFTPVQVGVIFNGGTPNYISLTPGIFTNETIINMLNAALQANSGTTDLTASFNTPGGYIILIDSLGRDIVLDFAEDPSAGVVLGFLTLAQITQGIYVTTEDAGSDGELDGFTPVNLSKYDSIYVAITLNSTDSNPTSSTDAYIGKYITCLTAEVGSFGGIIGYKNPYPTSFTYRYGQNVSSFTLELLSMYDGQLIAMNNQDWEITLAYF